FQAHNIALGVVSGARRSEIETVLERAMLRNAFEIIVAAEDITHSKPSPEGYQRAIATFSSRYPDWNLQPHHCLAIEDSFPGLEAARSAQIPVVGVAHTYPFHMMQRRANWAVDNLEDLEVERLLEVFSSDSKNDPEDPNNKRLEVSALASRHE
ncbi:MAG TPA: HAD family phosphatase, partial [Stenomitos sp.]